MKDQSSIRSRTTVIGGSGGTIDIWGGSLEMENSNVFSSSQNQINGDINVNLANNLVLNNLFPYTQRMNKSQIEALNKLRENQGSIELAQLQAMIELTSKVEELCAKEVPEQKETTVVTNLPEIQKVEVINDKETIEDVSILNFPEVQKVEITNSKDTQKVEVINFAKQDNSAILASLSDILEETKKKEQLELDLSLSEEIKDSLRGKDGSPDTAIEIADKLNTLKEKIDYKVIKGLRELISQNSGRVVQSSSYVGSKGFGYNTSGQLITMNSSKGVTVFTYSGNLLVSLGGAGISKVFTYNTTSQLTSVSIT